MKNIVSVDIVVDVKEYKIDKMAHFRDSSVTNFLKSRCVGSVTPDMLCLRLFSSSTIIAMSLLISVC